MASVKEPERSGRSPLLVWTLIALGLRAACAYTRPRWGHPDEWYQTIEYSGFLVNGFLVHTGEASLHLRNFLWPSMAAPPLALAEWLAPASIRARYLSLQLFTGVVSLGMLWGWWQLCKQLLARQGWRSDGWAAHALLALAVLPWFASGDFVRPSQENLAQIGLWVALGFLARGWCLAAGLAVVAVAAFKFPAALFGAGIALAVALQAWRARQWKPLLRFTAGALAGLALFGIPDWVMYGHPWESFWMHTQFNVLLGLSARDYGAQSALVYWELFKGHWGTALAPLGLVLALGFVPGWLSSLRRLEPWAYAFLFYVAGHLWIAHKEPRFIAPAEFLVVWGGVLGAAPWLAQIFARSAKPWAEGRARRFAATALVLLFLPNAALLAKQAWGTTWQSDSTYFDLPRHLREHPETCAVVSVRKPTGITLPWSPELGPSQAPAPPLAYAPIDKSTKDWDAIRASPLFWVAKAPNCGPGSRVLFHLHKPWPAWNSQGCEVLDSGVLSVLPRSRWEHALERSWVSGPWYSCPSSVLAAFEKQETRQMLFRKFAKFEKLPPLGVSPDAYMSYEKAGNPDHVEFGSFAEY